MDYLQLDQILADISVKGDDVFKMAQARKILKMMYDKEAENGKTD